MNALLLSCYLTMAGPATIESPDSLLVVVTADWCGPCRDLKPVVKAMEKDGWPVRIVDLEANREHVWIVKHRLASRPLPCLVMCKDRKGKHVWRIRSGVMERKAIERWVGQVPKVEEK